MCVYVCGLCSVYSKPANRWWNVARASKTSRRQKFNANVKLSLQNTQAYSSVPKCHLIFAKKLHAFRSQLDWNWNWNWNWKLKFLRVKTVSAKIIGGGNPFYLKFWIKLTTLERNRRFSISFRSYSDWAVTPSEKSSINTNRKSHTRFAMSPRWTSYGVPKPPKGGSKTQCPKFEQ